MKYIFTFASRKYLSAAKQQATIFKSLGYQHKIYQEFDLDKKLRIYCHKNKRGFGYWSWKPYIIIQALENIRNNDEIWYMDAGIFPLIKKPFPDFEKIFIMKNPASDMRQWCKPLPKFSNNIICEDVFNKLLVVDACMIGIKKSDYCIDLINLWKEYCKNDELISDKINKNYYHPNFDIFRDHRHDQSLLSIVSFEKDVKLKENLLNIGKLNFYHHRSKLSTPKAVLKVWTTFLFLLIYVNIFKLNKISFRLVNSDIFI